MKHWFNRFVRPTLSRAQARSPETGAAQRIGLESGETDVFSTFANGGENRPELCQQLCQQSSTNCQQAVSKSVAGAAQGNNKRNAMATKRATQNLADFFADFC